MEHTAKIVLNTELLGGGVPLTAEEVSRLLGLRGMYQTMREKVCPERQALAPGLTEGSEP